LASKAPSENFYHAAHSPTIAVIEDDVDVRQSMLELLCAEGFRAIGFDNGRTALEQLPKFPSVGLILLDLNMPVMDGWEFLKARKLATEEFIANIPVYVLSGELKGSKTLRPDNVAGWLPKPLDCGILLRLVHKYCPLGFFA
jgi:CheY-like chemotaxis protein